VKKLLLLLFLTPLLLPNVVFAAYHFDILVNEVAWMGTNSSSNDEWVELYNTTSDTVSLVGWSLKAVDGTPDIKLSGIIQANGYYLLERTDDTTVPGVKANKIYTGALGNNGEDLALYDNQSNLVDQADFSSGWTFGNNATKQTIERVDSSDWQTSKDPRGTPRQQNSTGAVIAPPAPQEQQNSSLPNSQKSDNNIAISSVSDSTNQLPKGSDQNFNPWMLFLSLGGFILIAGAGIAFLKLKNKL